MAEKLRRHVQDVLRESDCDFATERMGSPHTLAVTKNNNGFTTEVKNWNTR